MQNCVMVIAYFGDFANVYQYFETSFSWRGLVIGSTGLTPVFFKAEFVLIMNDLLLCKVSCVKRVTRIPGRASIP